MKKQIINFFSMVVIIGIFMTVIFLVSMIHARADEPEDVSDSLSNIKINITDSGSNEIVTDNVAQTGVSLLYGTGYNISVSWRIDSITAIEENDYITIDMGNGFFSYADTSLDNELTYGDKVIGKWGIQSNKIKCVFTEKISDFLSVEGYFNATGYFFYTNSGTTTVTVGGIDVLIDCNPPAVGFPYELYGPLLSGDNITKADQPLMELILLTGI